MNDFIHYFDFICPALCFIFCVLHSVVTLIVGRKNGKKITDFCNRCLSPKFENEEHICAIPFFEDISVVEIFLKNYYSVVSTFEHNCWDFSDRDVVRYISCLTESSECVELCDYLLSLDDLKFESALCSILLKNKEL